MFKKKKLYEVVYELYATYTTIIEAKDEYQALRKFKKEVGYGVRPSILSFKEISVR